MQINYLERAKLDNIANDLEIDFQQFLKAQTPYLTTEEIKILQKNGFTIGAHSIDHARFELISESEQIRQTLQSCMFVTDTFLEKYKFFAFPFSSYGVKSSFFEKIYHEIDLTFSTSAMFDTQNGKNIGRISMEGGYGNNAKDSVFRAYLSRLMKR